MSDLIVAIDDDQATRRMLTDYFEDHNLPVIACSSRREFDHCLRVTQPSLVLLDLQLGRDDGLDLLREIRSQSDVPVIIMTGHRLDEMDRVIGFELGADDYIVKPFSLRELLARVRALLRRQQMAYIPRGRDLERGGYRFNGWQLNRGGKSLFDPNGAVVSLSKGELALLVAFLEAPQRPLSREYLLQATRTHEDIFDRSIDIQVLRLRRKLEIDPKMPTVIKTERGVGYAFTMPVERF